MDDWRVARGNDFDGNGELTTDALVVDEQTARDLAGLLPAASFRVASVETRPYTRRPAAPFRTTTLQQEAGRKLGFTTDRTMRVTQELYESGRLPGRSRRIRAGGAMRSKRKDCLP